MKTKPFELSVLESYRMFFLLNNLPKDSEDYDIWIQTPAGYESVDFVDVFTMRDGSLLAAWKHPFEKLGLQNLVAFANGKTQILNLYSVERIYDIYDRDVDSDSGTFIFTASRVIENADWRCDRGYYGSRPFQGEVQEQVINDLGQIVFYEPFLSVAGIGHLIYIESNNRKELANEKINNSVIPVTGRTLQEVLRLIYEWSAVSKEPFNSSEEASVSAAAYLEALKFTDDELELIGSLREMQVASFLKGSNNARVRPSEIDVLSPEIANIVFDRMASSSLSFIISRNPELWGINEILEKEKNQLEAGMSRFFEFYGIDSDNSITDTEKIIDLAKNNFNQTVGPYVHNQLRLFKNKKSILNSI